MQPVVGAELASRIVWLDAFLTNVDRTFRNTNMLMWHKELWLIDHVASLYFHYSWVNWQKHAVSPFVQVKDHVLLPEASVSRRFISASASSNPEASGNST